MVFQKIGSAIRYCFPQFLAHIIYKGSNGKFNVILLPVERRVNIDVSLLVEETICRFYAVLCYHAS